jgi:hypothetical protein
MAKDTFGRSRHMTQAYTLTTFGKSLESGPGGYGKRLQGSNPAFVLIQGLGAIGTFSLLGDVTIGCVPFSLINTVAVAAATVTISLYDPNDAAFTPIVLCTTASLAAVGPLTLVTTTESPIPRDLSVRVVVAGANAAAARILLGLIPYPADWS